MTLTLYAAFLNVTDQVLKEKQEERRNERNRVFSQLVRSSVFEYDVPNDEITYSYYLASGKLVEYVITEGKNAFLSSDQSVDEKSRETFRTHLDNALKTPSEGSFEYLRSNKENKPCWYLVRYRSLSDGEKGVYKIVGCLNNIQQYKENKEAESAEATMFRLSVVENALLSLCFNTVTGARIPLAGDICPKGMAENITMEQFGYMFELLVHPEDEEAAQAFLKANEILSRKNGPSGKLHTECRVKALNKEYKGYHWVRFNYILLHNPRDTDQQLFIWVEDINREKTEILKQKELACKDALTGLYNRLGFREKSRRLLSQNSKEGSMFCFAFIDLDSFKRFNDQGGFAFGDEILIQTARIISGLTRENEVCGRYDADSFCVILQGRGKEDFEKRLQIFNSSIRREVKPGEVLTASIGGACCTYGADEFERFYLEAQEAQLEAKRSGGNCCVFYPDLKRSRIKKTIIETKHKIGIRTFGYFDVFVDGRAVLFKHSKAKELLALLVDRRGGTITTQGAIGCLWEDEPSNQLTQAKYRKAAMQLKETLNEYGIDYILENARGVRRIIPEYLDCDLYHYLSGENESRISFHGNYLLNYSWAETTCSALINAQKLEVLEKSPILNRE